MQNFIQAPSSQPASPVVPTQAVTLCVNGQNRTIQIAPWTSLLDALREYIGLTGTKKGCDHGQCGACTVLVDGQRINSCLALATVYQGKQIETIEGLGSADNRTASVGSAVQDACQALGKKVFRLAQKLADSPLADLKYADVQFVDGLIRANEDIRLQVAIRDVLANSDEEKVEATGGGKPDKAKQSPYSMHAHNAVFVEVKVNEDLGVVQVTRVVNAVAAGRIMNPKTARSQVVSSVVWGIGMALMEETVIDNHFGRFMNHNYAEYHIPVNADIHKIDVIFVEENDAIVNPIGVKGLGEVGMLGVTAAVANAIYHATGKRVRELPITLDKLL